MGPEETASNKTNKGWISSCLDINEGFFLNPVWRQNIMIISKEYAPLGVKALILVERS